MKPDFPVFSPSSTSAYMRCPMYWHLSHNWKPKATGYRDISAIMGKCVMAWLEELYTLDEPTNDNIVDNLYNELTDGLDINVSFSPIDVIQNTINHLEQIINTRLKLSKLIPSVTNPLYSCCEIPLMDYGRARPDLIIVDTINEEQHVIDFKFKKSLDKRYRERTILDYGTSEQAMFYPWAISNNYGRPCNNFYIGLIIAEPFSFELFQYPVDHEAQELWLTGRKVVWQQMAENRLWLTDTHETKYGQCEYKKACLEYKLDDDLIQLDYDRIEQ